MTSAAPRFATWSAAASRPLPISSALTDPASQPASDATLCASPRSSQVMARTAPPSCSATTRTLQAMLRRPPGGRGSQDPRLFADALHQLLRHLVGRPLEDLRALPLRGMGEAHRLVARR